LLPAHEVVAPTDVVVEDGDLELIGLIVVHIEIELFQPERAERFVLVLQRNNANWSFSLFGPAVR